MDSSRLSPVVVAVAMAAVGAALFFANKGPAKVGQDIGGAVVDLADGVLSGAVFTLGDKLGIPDTRDQSIVSQGQAELNAGDYWNASFHLPAKDFIAGTWSKLTGD